MRPWPCRCWTAWCRFSPPPGLECTCGVGPGGQAWGWPWRGYPDAVRQRLNPSSVSRRQRPARQVMRPVGCRPTGRRRPLRANVPSCTTSRRSSHIKARPDRCTARPASGIRRTTSGRFHAALRIARSQETRHLAIEWPPTDPQPPARIDLGATDLGNSRPLSTASMTRIPRARSATMPTDHEDLRKTVPDRGTRHNPHLGYARAIAFELLQPNLRAAKRPSGPKIDQRRRNKTLSRPLRSGKFQMRFP